MAYTAKNWRNVPDTTTPITAEDMTRIETEIERLSNNGPLIARGTLPSDTDLNTLNKLSDAGVWHLAAANTYVNLPDGLTLIQGATLEVVPSGNFSAVAQRLSHNTQFFQREIYTGSTWQNWRQTVTPDLLPELAPSLFGGRLLSTSANLDELEPGIYYVNYASNATLLGLPGRTGRLTVVRTSTGGRIQRYETTYGTYEVASQFRPYEIWVRGMDSGGVYHPNFTKILTTADDPAAEESHASVAHTVRATNAKSTYAEDMPFYSKAADSLNRPASTTKVLTGYVARQIITDAKLDDPVTVLTADPNPGGSGSDTPLQAGDVLTFRELFYLVMLPSHNQAAEILARAVGDLMPGTGTGREKFVAEMQAKATDWWGADRVFVNPTGLGNTNQVTASDLVNLMYRVATDTFLVECMGTQNYVVNITGPNAREITATHTVDPLGPVKFPDMVAAKSGSLTGHTCLVMLYRKSNGTLGAAALMGSNTASRYLDMRQIINYAKMGPDKQYLVG